MAISVSPHPFEPLRRFSNRGRCRACLLHEDDHDRRRRPYYPDWPRARAVGDKRAALPWPEAFKR